MDDKTSGACFAPGASRSATGAASVSAHMGNAPSRICGEYVDQIGRKWFCVQGYHPERPHMIVCEGVKGNPYRTACGTNAFAAWSWTASEQSA